MKMVRTAGFEPARAVWLVTASPPDSKSGAFTCFATSALQWWTWRDSNPRLVGCRAVSHTMSGPRFRFPEGYIAPRDSFAIGCPLTSSRGSEFSGVTNRYFEGMLPLPSDTRRRKPDFANDLRIRPVVSFGVLSLNTKPDARVPLWTRFTSRSFSGPKARHAFLTAPTTAPLGSRGDRGSVIEAGEEGREGDTKTSGS